MQIAAQFSAIASKHRIDTAAGIIHGVSVVTMGEATGHGLLIDQKTLEQMRDTASAYAGGLKVKMNHGSDFQSIVGVLKGFVMDGNQLRADLHLLQNSKERDRVLEMAEKMPDGFGLSVSFSNEPEEIEGRKFARCAEIYSADLVDSPAANPSGLFSKPNTNMNEPNTTAEDVAKLAAEIADLKKVQEAYKPTDLSKVTADIESAKVELAKLTKAASDAADAAKKTEIIALVAEASRDGKVVPLTDVQLSKMDVADIKEMIAKLPKAQVQLARKPLATTPKDKDGKDIDRNNTEAVREFCRIRREEGAAALDALFREQSLHN